jgi:hypothetical protein
MRSKCKWNGEKKVRMSLPTPTKSIRKTWQGKDQIKWKEKKKYCFFWVLIKLMMEFGKENSENVSYYSDTLRPIALYKFQNAEDQDIQNNNSTICFYGCETLSLILREGHKLQE